MKTNQAYVLWTVSLLLVWGSLAQASEASSQRKQQRALLKELINAPLKTFHDLLPHVERPIKNNLISRLVKAHAHTSGVWERLALEAKIDRLIDDVRGFEVPEAVKAEWYELYNHTSPKRFRMFVEGLAKGSGALSRIGLGNSPDPRVAKNTHVKPFGGDASVDRLADQSPVKRLTINTPTDHGGVSWTKLLTGVVLVGVGLCLYAASTGPKNVHKGSVADTFARKIMGNMRKV